MVNGSNIIYPDICAENFVYCSSWALNITWFWVQASCICKLQSLRCTRCSFRNVVSSGVAGRNTSYTYIQYNLNIFLIMFWVHTARTWAHWCHSKYEWYCRCGEYSFRTLCNFYRYRFILMISQTTLVSVFCTLLFLVLLYKCLGCLCYCHLNTANCVLVWGITVAWFILLSGFAPQTFTVCTLCKWYTRNFLSLHKCGK